MPRDLLADKKTLDEMPELSRNDAASSPQPEESAPINFFTPTILKEERFKKMGDIHPFSGLLNLDDLDDCDWLEHAAFDANEAATREKLEYRLRTCGELCSGIFSSAYSTSSGPLGEIIKARQFQAIDSTDSDRKRILLGHIIATKSSSHVVTNDSMAYPEDWRTKYQLTPSIGHNEDGDTVCIHSLCVHPNFGGKGLGSILLKSYVQRIKDSGVAKRVALICRDHLVQFYEKAGFERVGPSKVQYGGGTWVDMVYDFDDGFDDDEHGY